MPLDSTDGGGFMCLHCHRMPPEITKGTHGFCTECSTGNQSRIDTWLAGRYDPFLDMVRDGLTADNVPVPSPTGTELALTEAKRHILIMAAFFMENPQWVAVAENAREFVFGLPKESRADERDRRGSPSSGA